MDSDQPENQNEIADLYRKVERQQGTIQQLKKQISSIKAAQSNDVGGPEDTDSDSASESTTGLSRRALLQAAAIGTIGTGVGYTYADSTESEPLPSRDQFQVNEDGSIQGRVTNNERLTDIAGQNLWIDPDGVLNAAGNETASLSDGSIVANPGGVQNAIDQIASSGHGVVRLNAKETYMQDDSFPWHVRPGVILDFNGAILYGSGTHPETDLIHVHPTAKVLTPKIDLWDRWDAYDRDDPYTGRVFTFDSKYGAYFADGTTVRGGWTMAVESTGTWLYFGKHNTSDTRVNHVSSVTIETDLRKPNEPAAVNPIVIDKGIHLDTSGPRGYINSIVFRGMVRGARTAICQEGAHPNNGHIFDGIFQQPDGSEAFWHIKSDTFSRGTVVRGKIWDVNTTTYPDGSAWLIETDHEDAGENAINAKGFSPVFVQNDSPNDQYVTNPVTSETTVV